MNDDTEEYSSDELDELEDRTDWEKLEERAPDDPFADPEERETKPQKPAETKPEEPEEEKDDDDPRPSPAD